MSIAEQIVQEIERLECQKALDAGYGWLINEVYSEQACNQARIHAFVEAERKEIIQNLFHNYTK